MNNKLNMESVFTDIYEQCIWGNNECTQYRGSSGYGSSPEYNIEYINFMKNFIDTYNIQSISDAGCGDWRLGKSLFYNINIKYNGYDIYHNVIKFLQQHYSNSQRNFFHLDILKNKDYINNADLLIVKDVMQHWDDVSAEEFLDWSIESKKFKFILICNCISGHNDEQAVIGGWRGLGSNHPLFKDRGFQSVLKYHTKEVLLYKST